jgi:hypothetical protein
MWNKNAREVMGQSSAQKFYFEMGRDWPNDAIPFEQ